MNSESENTRSSTFVRGIATLLGLPWVEIAAEAWKLGRKIWCGFANEGMYEVLEYDSTLELQTPLAEKPSS
jgi:hypothetical protein